MQPPVGGQLGVEGGGQHAALAAGGDRAVAEGREHLDARPGVAQARGADEDGAHRIALDAGAVEIGLERVGLPPEGVALGGHVEDAEGGAVEFGGAAREQDRARAGAPGREAALDALAQRLVEAEGEQQPRDRRALPARQDQAVHGVEPGEGPHLARGHAEAGERLGVLAHVALQRQHSDAGSGGGGGRLRHGWRVSPSPGAASRLRRMRDGQLPRMASCSSAGRAAAERPRIGAPAPREASASSAGSR